MPHADGATTASSRRLDVVHVVSSATFAGVERYVVDVSIALTQRGHRVRVIGDRSLFAGPLDGVPVELIDAVGVARVTTALGEVRASDVLHVHMTAAELAALAAWPLNRVPAVATRHFAKARGSSRPVRALAPVIRRRLARQLAISSYVAATIGEASTVLHSGVRNAAAVSPCARVALIAQRLEREKRTGEALAAWARAGLEADGWELWIAGGGRLRDELEEQARDLGLQSVRFLGHCDDLEAVRGACGMQLATVTIEAFGLSVVEAMAAGLPVVAADGGAHRETVGACEPSLLYPPGDLDACAAIMRRLAADVDERVAIGARLRAFQQEHFSLERHVDALERVYAEVAR